jgi:hypothetical protein
MIKLMKKSVGIANSSLRRVKVSMACDAFVHKGWKKGGPGIQGPPN